MGNQSVKETAKLLLLKSGLNRPVASALDLAKLGHQFSSGDPRFDATRFLRRSSRELRAKVNEVKESPVLVFSPFTISTLILALRLRGADARAVVCDSALCACEFTGVIQFSPWQRFLDCKTLPSCEKCFAHHSSVESFGIPVVRLGSYVQRPGPEQESVTSHLTLKDIFSYRADGIDYGEQIRTASHRFFLAGRLENDEQTLLTARRYLAQALSFAAGLEKMIDDIKPAVLLAYQGIYLIGGVACEVARKKGVRVVVWGSVYRKNAIMLSHGQTYHHELRLEPCDPWENDDLTPEQNRRLDEYINQRRAGGVVQDRISFNSGTVSQTDRISSMLGLDRKRKQVMLFTNVAWDGRVKSHGSLFEGPTEWVIDTIRHLASRDDVQVVVRIHPAEVREAGYKGLQRVDEEIRRALPQLPANVTIILPEQKINSYALAELADLVMVYSSRIGLEVLLRKKPVVIVGDAFYADKKIGIQPRTTEEYLTLLNRLDQVPQPTDKDLIRVRRYAYHYFFRRWLDLPLTTTGRKGDLFARDLQDLLPGKCNALDRACNGVLDAKPFHVGAL